ncbi:MAG: hypothetical protein WCQ99_09955 [Pseudomonadota bacterium]
MKVHAVVFPILEAKGEHKAERKSILSEKTVAREDRVSLSGDMMKIVMEENKSASETDPADFKKAEETLASLQSRLMHDTATASEAHRFSDKKVFSFVVD